MLTSLPSRRMPLHCQAFGIPGFTWCVHAAEAVAESDRDTVFARAGAATSGLAEGSGNVNSTMGQNYTFAIYVCRVHLLESISAI